MNPLIKKLIEQSYDEVPGISDWDITTTVFNKEKFAELLIMECDKFVTANFHSAGWTLGYKMKKHFGVNDES
jgi:hypothetical protein